MTIRAVKEMRDTHRHNHVIVKILYNQVYVVSPCADSDCPDVGGVAVFPGETEGSSF